MGGLFDDAYLRDLRDPFHPLHDRNNGSGSVTKMHDRCYVYGCTFGHTEECYDAGNRQEMDYGASLYRAKQGRPDAPDTIKLECFNKPEAERAEAYMKSKYPDIPFFATWLTWPLLEKGRDDD